jgi:hypothetical protein
MVDDNKRIEQEKKLAALVVTRMLLFARDDLCELGMSEFGVLMEICVREIKRRFRFCSEDLTGTAD